MLFCLLSVVFGSDTLLALNDPTRPASYRPSSQKVERFQLSSILLGFQRKVAVINGRAVTEGESLGSATVIKIEKERVLLTKGGKRIELVPKRTAVKREN